MFCLFYNIYFLMLTICMKYYSLFSFSTMFEETIPKLWAFYFYFVCARRIYMYI